MQSVCCGHITDVCHLLLVMYVAWLHRSSLAVCEWEKGQGDTEEGQEGSVLENAHDKDMI